jgi:hypothetical protein
VFNSKDYALDYREVVTEDSVEVEGAAKAPDYAFKIGRERKFFVEAKKPAVNIEYDIHPAYQLRRYAWNAHLPLGILTDFEEFAVYECRNKPTPGDSAATGRVMFYKYKEYLTKWDEIAAIFSREAVLKGSFDKYAEEHKGKKGTTEVDDAFLKDIENWRELLARNIALRNPQVADEQQLNYAVQMTIDRMLFLRICEDRGIEPENQLQQIAKRPGIYPQLVELFRRADVKYNSGLFHLNTEKGQTSPADTFTPGLKIDDKTLKEITSSLYYPCPYIFKEIPVEILGQVYDPADSGAHRQGGRETRSAQSGRGVLHAALHRGLHRGEYGGQTAGRQNTHRSRRLEDRGSGVRERFIPAGGVPVPDGLAFELVFGEHPGTVGERQKPGSDAKRGRRVEADHSREETHFGE